MRDQVTAARALNIALGLWLFISAFLWPDSYSQFTNRWLVGLLCTLFAVIAIWAPQARFLNTALAVWLFISVWALPTRSSGTLWNNVLVSIAIFVLSLLPSSREVRTTPTGAPRT